MNRNRKARFMWKKGDIKIGAAQAHKATDEPPPAVRGEPLPKDEAIEGWEITEGDIEKAQRWVDRAMREAGFVD